MNKFERHDLQRRRQTRHQESVLFKPFPVFTLGDLVYGLDESLDPISFTLDARKAPVLL